MNKKAGFTLIELLLVIGLTAILMSLTAPLGMRFYRSQMVESARTELIEILTKARHNAALMKGDSRWGVYITPDDLSSASDLVSFTFYRGNNYNEKESDYDEVYSQPANLEIYASGTNDLLVGDINFSKLSGTTTATGTITIRHSSGSEARSILINNFGNVYATSTSN